MNKLLTSLQFLLLFLFAFNVIAQEKASSESVTQYQLENGLTVILNEDHSSHEIFGLIVCKAGAKNDPSDATGMAHYQEHMLFKGTDELGTKNWEKEEPLINEIIELYKQLGQTSDAEKRLEIQKEINKVSIEAAQYAIPNEFSTIVNSMGGSYINANTSADRTVYFNKFPSNQTEKWLDLYSHRFINPVFRLFQSELEIVYEEKNKANDIFVIPLIEKFNQEFFKNHPYGQQTIIGTIEHLKSPPLHKMIEFYETYYVANNMALILVGDFDTETIMPMIEEKFGSWHSSEIPEFPVYSEEDFKGREQIDVKMSPIKLGIIGYRSPSQTHPDQVIMDVMQHMLSNDNQTGLMDKLILDNKLLMSIMFSMPYNDHGQTLILFVPKIIGQKLPEAEALVMAELEKLKKGDFDDDLLESQKKSIYKNWQLESENIASKGMKMAEFFQQGKNISEMFNYADQVNKITREDIILIANKNFNENYLVLYSKRGKVKPERIKQPAYEAVSTTTDTISPYRAKFDKIPSGELNRKYLDFESDLNRILITKGINLYHTTNPQNDIFKLTIRYGIGEYEMPLLRYSSYIMNVAGTKEMDVHEFRNTLSKLGCSYTIYSDNNYLYVDLEGIDENFEEAFNLIQQLLNDPQIDEEKISQIYENEKAERKLEKSEPTALGDALLSYVKYGQESPFINRLSLKDIKTLNVDTLAYAFKEASIYETDYFYSGTFEEDALKDLLKKNIRFLIEPKKSQSPIQKKTINYSENKVVLINTKKARQSNIYFFINGKPYSKDDDAFINAFNFYFGGAFAGLVLQEICEYRSLAYTARAKYHKALKAGEDCSFEGYIGTQADKTLEAVEVFNNLVRSMPEKTERMDFIKKYLEFTSISQKPGFRNKSRKILKMQLQGFDDDPVKMNVPKYQNMTFDNILEFYKENIKDQAMVIAIVGNLKQFDYKQLEQFGAISIVKEKDLFSK